VTVAGFIFNADYYILQACQNCLFSLCMMQGPTSSYPRHCTLAALRVWAQWEEADWSACFICLLLFSCPCGSHSLFSCSSGQWVLWSPILPANGGIFRENLTDLKKNCECRLLKRCELVSVNQFAEAEDASRKDTLAAKRIWPACQSCQYHRRHRVDVDQDCSCTEFLMNAIHKCEDGSHHMCKDCYENLLAMIKLPNSRIIVAERNSPVPNHVVGISIDPMKES